MKRVLMLAMGVMTAIGGFVDVGNIVTSGITGSRYRMTLAWAVVFGTVGIILFAEMAGRVTAVSGRAVFHVVRERLGARMALVNLIAVVVLNLATLAAEIGGLGLTLQLATGINYIIWIPLMGALVWLVIWRATFQTIERVFGIVGLCLIVFAVAMFFLPTHWGALASSALHPHVPKGEEKTTWWFYAVSLIGAAVIPYQLVFFSSGSVEEKWTVKDLSTIRFNTFVGFPLGAVIALFIMGAAVPVLAPARVGVSHLGQIGLPVSLALGKIGLAAMLVGVFAALFAAAAESTLATGYAVAQYFGTAWGKRLKPGDAAEFHTVMLVSVLVATTFILTTIDPIAVTIVSVVLGAAAVPLTFLPVLVVANDRGYMGEHVNRRWVNALASAFFAVIVVVSLVTLPLLFITKAGQ